jgi:(1->4)-alpha-D-glucan 1-alpha-D-glucosylmutase
MTVTYRLQLNRDFTFDDAAELAPYLQTLGITDLYLSPYLKARPGSRHGYDIVDHNAFNPELGGEEGFERLHATLKKHELGQILDFVPNHMGVAHADNPWWLDVLEWGRNSAHAAYFDIDWQPIKPELQGKVMLPFLGDYYGKVLEAGELKLHFDPAAGTFHIAAYEEHLAPIGPRHYPRVLGEALTALRQTDNGDAAETLSGLIAGFAALPAGLVSTRRRSQIHSRAADLKRRLAALAAESPSAARAIDAAVAKTNGTVGDPPSFIPLHRLLERQAYRFCYWKVAADEINYRRFFDVNDLAGIRVELPDLFDTIHRLVLRLVGEGKLQGLRLDHVDGLFDPSAYCRKLRHRLTEAAGSGPMLLLVEKILEAGEALPRDWAIDGSTGYDFLNEVQGLFVDGRGERPLTALYRRFCAHDPGFTRILYESKKEAIEHLLPSELQVLAKELDGIAETNWQSRDFTLARLTTALAEVVACFPVYRSYVTERGPDTLARRYIGQAIAEARRRSRGTPEVFDFIQDVLTLDFVRRDKRSALRRQVTRFAMKVQQYTSPVMAKGAEDTAFYRYHRLIALNEVGGDPRRFSLSLASFHEICRERAQRWPRAMLATTTHDTKRAEDLRARLCVLSELPADWAKAVRNWSRINRRVKLRVDGESAPDANDEYLIYQTLLGSWPARLTGEIRPDPHFFAAYRQRLRNFAVKAIREAKFHSSWTRPNPAYEEAAAQFIDRILDPGIGAVFLADFVPFQARIAAAGMINSLAQTLIKLTVPGIPDIYQGSELWDMRLVDPDNRAPVDFERRERLLTELERDFPADASIDPGRLQAMLDAWPDGRIKLYLIWKALQFRREHAGLFAAGDYIPLPAEGPAKNHLCAYARLLKNEAVVVVVPRFAAKLGAPSALADATIWEETQISLAALAGTTSFRNLLTGRPVVAADGTLQAKSLFLRLPLAFLQAT